MEGVEGEGFLEAEEDARWEEKEVAYRFKLILEIWEWS